MKKQHTYGSLYILAASLVLSLIFDNWLFFQIAIGVIIYIAAMHNNYDLND